MTKKLRLFIYIISFWFFSTFKKYCHNLTEVGVGGGGGEGRRGDFIERYIRTHSTVKVEVITSACGSTFVFLCFYMHA